MIDASLIKYEQIIENKMNKDDWRMSVYNNFLSHSDIRSDKQEWSKEVAIQ